MYEQSAQWNTYYREIDPKKRKSMFTALCRDVEDDGANAFRERLFQLRHGDKIDDKQQVDNFLWQCVSMPFFYKSAKVFVRKARKDVADALKSMGFSEVESYGEAGEKALYWELRNTARRYFSTCESREYRKKLFGLVSASDEERTNQIVKDAWQMSCGIAERVKMQEEMRIFSQAVRDEYTTLDEGADRRFEEYAAAQKA